MALNGATLAALIQTNIQALTNFPTTGQTPNVIDNRVLVAIANAIVSHIQSSAVVTIPSVSGVTTGTGVSGPGTGTVG
jgi:hypothetical protein